jgi:hypothetical protein
MAAKKPTKMKASKTKGRAKAKAKAAPAIKRGALHVKDALRVDI